MKDKLVEDMGTLLDTIEGGLIKIVKAGAKKHGAQSWREEGNPSLNHKSNAASINRHLSEFTVNPEAWNEEDGCYHLENAITRLAMALYRIKVGTYDK